MQCFRKCWWFCHHSSTKGRINIKATRGESGLFLLRFDFNIFVIISSSSSFLSELLKNKWKNTIHQKKKTNETLSLPRNSTIHMQVFDQKISTKKPNIKLFHTFLYSFLPTFENSSPLAVYWTCMYGLEWPLKWERWASLYINGQNGAFIFYMIWKKKKKKKKTKKRWWSWWRGWWWRGWWWWCLLTF